MCLCISLRLNILLLSNQIIFKHKYPTTSKSISLICLFPLKKQVVLMSRAEHKGVVFRMIKVYIGVLCILLAFVYLNGEKQENQLHKINNETHQLLNRLIKTRYFRLFKANLNQECELYVRNKICRSQSCTVCRCDEKDIPMNWIKTDKVQKAQQKVQQFEETPLKQSMQSQQNRQISWSWHVQDDENAQGEYFDLDKNIESFTSYNGSTIWQMIYEENCFPGSKDRYAQEQLNGSCKEQKVFFKIISGLHTSISTHLARFYKNATSDVQLWADLREEKQRFFVNWELYHQRVLNHPERVQNLMFIYQVYLRAIKQISHYMRQNYTIHSDNSKDDNDTLALLHQLSQKFQHYEFEPFDAELRTFFYKQNPKVKLYQKYIHNISRLMNCVECEKCRLFGKMQTFGIGTALKILLGYQDLYKRNQIVALYNAWNKISMSIEFYFSMTHQKEQIQYRYDWFWFRWFATVAGAFIFFMYLIENINIQEKTKKMFKNVTFPKQKMQRINNKVGGKKD